MVDLMMRDLPAEIDDAVDRASSYVEKLSKKRTPELSAEWKEVHAQLMAAQIVLRDRAREASEPAHKLATFCPQNCSDEEAATAWGAGLEARTRFRPISSWLIGALCRLDKAEVRVDTIRARAQRGYAATFLMASAPPKVK
jgi:hypothetical protein